MHGTGRHIHAGDSPCLYAVALFASFCLVLKNPIKSARQLSCPATKKRLVLMKKVYEDMCDEDRFASDRVLRRRALQSYLLYDARGTAAIFGLPGKSTGEGSISSINTACAHRIGRGQVWIPCDCHGSWTRIYRGSGTFTRAVSTDWRVE